MTTTVAPDVLAALIVRLRANTDLAAIVGTQVSAEMQEPWPTLSAAVLLIAVGGQAPDEDTDLEYQRVDVSCYGSTGYEAAKLSRMVDAVLRPVLRERPRSFHSAGCAVYDVSAEGALLTVPDPDYPTWPRRLRSYAVTYSRVGVT